MAIRVRRVAAVAAIAGLGLTLTVLLATPAPAQLPSGSVTQRSGQAPGAAFAQQGDWLERLGWLAYVVAPLLMFVVAVLPLPAEMPAALNGVLFGPVVGFFLTWGGALAGAQVSYELARRFGRPLVERFVKPSALERLDRAVESGGPIALLTLRLIPTVAFTAVNWGAGMASVRRSTFFWTTAVGIIPGALVFTATGSGVFHLLETRGAAFALGAVFVVAVALALAVRRLLKRVARHSPGA